MSHIIHLTVTEPFTEIVGSPDIYVQEGATMNLTCIVKDCPEPPQYIFWYHNQREISYDSPRGGVSQITEKGIIRSYKIMMDLQRHHLRLNYILLPTGAAQQNV